jgi:hypothetical protein
MQGVAVITLILTSAVFPLRAPERPPHDWRQPPFLSC